MSHLKTYEGFLGNKEKSQEARKTNFLSKKIYNFLDLFNLYDLKLVKDTGSFNKPYNTISIAGKLIITINLVSESEIHISIKNPEYFTPKMILPMEIDKFLINVFSNFSSRVAHRKFYANDIYIDPKNVDAALKELTKEKLEFYSNVNKYNL